MAKVGGTKMGLSSLSQVLPLSTPETYPGIGGTSLVTALRRMTRNPGPPAYWEFRAACDFIAALLLHEQVVLVGRVSEHDQAFLDELRRHVGDAIASIAPGESDWVRLVGSPGTQKLLTRTLHDVFGRRAPAFTPAGLAISPTNTRFVDDHQQEVMTELLSRAAEQDNAGMADYLLREYVRSLTASERQYFVNYLFRTFVYVAVALNLHGTAVIDGARTVVLRLIQSRLGTSAPRFLGVRLYDAANEAFRIALRPVAGALSTPFIPLAVMFVMTENADGDLLSGIKNAREQLSGYRDEMVKYQRTLLSEDVSVAAKQAVYAEVLGAGAEYLSQITRTLSLRQLGIRGLVDKLWVNSVDSVLGQTEVSMGTDGATSITGSAIGVVRAARRSWSQQKRDHTFSALLKMLNAVVTTPRALANAAARLRIDGMLDDRQNADFERVLFPSVAE